MWRFAAAKTVGTSHLKVGAPCQDRFACAATPEGVVLAVADGAGSAARSEIGAELAVTTVTDHLARALDGTAGDWSARLIEAARAARTTVLARAIEDGCASRDYASTLLVVVATAVGGAALQLGDGVIAYRDIDGWAPLFWPQKGEYANMTHFLTDDGAEGAWEVACLPGHEIEIALMSDGLENLALNFATRSVHEPFLEALFTPLRAATGTGDATRVSTALETFLASSRIAERADDDLTIVLATRS